MTYRITIERLSPTGVLVDARVEVDEEVLRELHTRLRAERLRGNGDFEGAVEWALFAEPESVPGRTYGAAGVG